MMMEERIHFGVLLESIETSVKVLAEGHGALVEANRALVERLDRMESRFDTRFDRLEVKVDGLEAKVDRLEVKVDGLEAKVDGLEVSASDAQQRLGRIETHLQLNGSHGSSPRRKATRDAPPKRRKKP